MFKIIFSYILVFLGWTVMYIQIRSPVWMRQINSLRRYLSVKAQAVLGRVRSLRSPQEEEER